VQFPLFVQMTISEQVTLPCRRESDVSTAPPPRDHAFNACYSDGIEIDASSSASTIEQACQCVPCLEAQTTKAKGKEMSFKLLWARTAGQCHLSPLLQLHLVIGFLLLPLSRRPASASAPTVLTHLPGFDGPLPFNLETG
jgi:hypothetical protein